MIYKTDVFKAIRKTWKFQLTILTPIVLSAIPLTWKGGSSGQEPYAAFVVCLMGIYWMTECVPIPVTAFLPIILFPLFGILSTERITTVYLQDSLLFLLGGCIIALSFEFSNLHSRIALKVMMLVGTKISQLLLGLMGTTMFLSMWMNNTSTTAMMIPIVNALVEELRTKMVDNSTGRRASILSLVSIEMIPIGRRSSSIGRRSSVADEGSPTEAEESEPVKESRRNYEDEKLVKSVHIMFLLGIAYASNIGGTGVITGSATNLIVLDLVRKDSEEPTTAPGCRNILEISFLDWMLFNIPSMIINTLLVYFYLQLHFLGIPARMKVWQKRDTAAESLAAKSGRSMQQRIKQTICAKYRALGPIEFNEWAVLTLFGVMVTLWVFKDPQFMPGWDSFFPKTKKGNSIIKEATPTLLVTILMFIIPSKWSYFQNFKKGGLSEGLQDPLLNWSFVQKKFPWGIFLLLGGGASMAVGAKESGLNKWFGAILASNETLQSLPNFVLLILVLVMIAILTTVASNTAVAAIITPVLLGMSYVKDVHPLYLVLPAATVCSYAFVLPVSTPPNAMVYNASDNIKLGDMMLPGFVINVFTIIVLLLTTITSSELFFSFSSYENQCFNMTSQS